MTFTIRSALAYDLALLLFRPRVAASMCNECSCDNCFAEGGRGGEHAVIVDDKSIKGPRLWPSQFP